MRMTILMGLMLTFSSNLFAKPKHVGVIVKRQGDVQILKNPSKKLTGKGPHVLYEGIYYTIGKIRPGTKVENGNIVKTGKDGKVKVVFKNGDQYNVGIGTAYQISWSSSKGKSKNSASTINLIHGTLRGIISKKGPRSGLKIKTKHAVMGIRGTDFCVGQKGTSGKSSLAVLRGKVQLIDKKNPKKVLEIKKGLSAEVKISQKMKGAKITQVLKTSKDEMRTIEEETKITKKEDEKVSVKVSKELAKLEKKAVENTLTDIKEYEPKLYEKLKKQKIKDVDSINTIVATNIIKKAPKKRVKIDMDDLDLDESTYDEYYKPDSY